MDKKVLLLTNFGSWYDGIPDRIRNKVDWKEKSYPNKNNPIVKCVTNQGCSAMLQPVDNLSAEGIYLVFDDISHTKLDALLDECEQKHDLIFVLFHSIGYYKHQGAFSSWKHLFPIKGMHEEGDSYELTFNILTDSENDKLNRIINSVFMPLDNAINTFLDECTEPKKNLENLLSYHILCEEGFKDAVEAFRNKYESCQSSSEYAEDWDRLNDLLKGVSEK